MAADASRARARRPRATPDRRTVCVRLVVFWGGLSMLGACALVGGRVDRSLETAAAGRDALATSDALEALIAVGKDTPADRHYAYDVVRRHEEDTAEYTYARAVVTGRLVQMEGLLGAGKIPDVERYARRSRELEPEFRAGAATRVLGTLYVIAPANLLVHGDSEEGLALLEGLVQRHPETSANHLRLAEAYVALGDPAPAGPHLCLLLSHRDDLHPDERILLDRLVREVGGAPCVARWRLPQSSGRSRERIHSAAGSAVKSASIESPKASADSTPNSRIAGRSARPKARKPPALIMVAKRIARPAIRSVWRSACSTVPSVRPSR
jgi:hypothetical protein